MSMETKDEPRREEGYERRDADVRALLKFGVGLAVTLVIVILAMRWTFSFLSKEEPLGPPPTPFENARVLPPQPRLQLLLGRGVAAHRCRSRLLRSHCRPP